MNATCAWFQLEDVLVTEELERRPTRKPDLAQEARAFLELSDVRNPDPVRAFNQIAQVAIELCQADSAGISILEGAPGNEQFVWPAIAGKFAGNVGNGMARWASPCGVVLDQNRPLLFQRPEFYFPYAVLVAPPIIEALLVPFHIQGKPQGTIWVIAHHSDRKFDKEDMRILGWLAPFVAQAAQLQRAESVMKS